MSWSDVEIQEVCSHAVDCVNRTAPVVDEETPFKMIRTSNVKNGRIDVVNVRYVSEETYDRWTRRLVPQKGDVVLTREAPLGEIGRITTDDTIFLGQRLFHYRADPNRLDPNFLAYVLMSPVVQGRIRARGFGATVEHAKVGDCLNLPIPLPPLDLQNKIGGILSAYDDLIENNRRRITLLEQAARELYREWFVRLKFPGHEQAKIIDGLPEGWELLPVSEIVNINPTEKVERSGLIRHVPMTSLSETGMTVETNLIEERERATSVKFRYGDTLLARITPCLENGKTGFVYFLEPDELACGSTEYIVMRGNKVSPYFTYCLAREEEFRARAIKSMIGSSGRQRVQPGFMNDYRVCKPDGETLEKFDELAKQYFDQIAVLDKQKDQAAQARDLLLPRLMSGKISV